MNRDTLALVQSLLVFAVSSVSVLIVIYGIIQKAIKNVWIDASGKKHYRLVGVLARYDSLDILSLSLLTIRQFYFIWCLFQSKNSWVYLCVLVILGFLYNILSGRFVNLLVDFLNCCLLYVALFLKNVFYSYTVNVVAVWHVILFLILLIICSLLYSWFFYFKNIEDITERNIKRLRSKNKK